MKYFLLSLLLLAGIASARVSDTIESDGEHCLTSMPVGTGNLTLVYNSGTANVVLEYLRLDGTWQTHTTYTDDVTPDIIDFGPVEMTVRLNVNSASSANVYCEIRAANVR